MISESRSDTYCTNFTKIRLGCLECLGLREMRHGTRGYHALALLPQAAQSRRQLRCPKPMHFGMRLLHPMARWFMQYAQHPDGAVNSTTVYPFELREWRHLPDQENTGVHMASSTGCSDVKCLHLLALSKDHSLMMPSLATPSRPGRDLLRASLAPAATISETIHQSSRSETSVRTNKSHTLIFSGAHG